MNVQEIQAPLREQYRLPRKLHWSRITGERGVEIPETLFIRL